MICNALSLAPLVVHASALLSLQVAGHSVPPADVIRCDLPGTPPAPGLLQIDDLAAMALGAAVLCEKSVNQAFRGSVTILKNLEGSGATLRVQTIPLAGFLSIALFGPACAGSFPSFEEAFG